MSRLYDYLFMIFETVQSNNGMFFLAVCNLPMADYKYFVVEFFYINEISVFVE